MDTSTFFQGFILTILLILSGFFSSTETALFSLNKVRILHMAEEGNKKAQLVMDMLDEPNRLIATILVGNNIVNIGASALATSLAIDIFGSKGVGIATGVMTLLVLVFGEVTPKTFAAQNAEKWSLAIINIIIFLSQVLLPIIKILGLLTNLLLKITGNKTKQDPFITEDELKLLVNVGQEEGLIAESEREMINSIFEFDDTLVREIMTPRIDMIVTDVNETFANVVATAIDAGHSRIPVYEDTIDNIIGIIYAKDLLKNINKDFSTLEIRKLMRPAYYIPETKKVRDLLAELRQAKVHMAIVIDEYGGTAGLVTIEDVIEEIIGDIQDEFDIEEESIIMLSDGSIRADARASIYDINEALDTELPDDDYETISGLVFHLLGHIPKEGEELSLENVKIMVEKTLGRRVDKVRIWKEDN
ncbi:MAG: magnesium and cobalt exporter, family [Clostridia bacterium]|nr:magnesium and cobalt exporter, family [Clostridia bacterium]